MSNPRNKTEAPTGESGRRRAVTETSVTPDLVAALAHTIQTPLQSITINAEMLQELLRGTENATLRDRGTRMLSRVIRETNSLQSIVKDFLALVRLGSIESVPTDMNLLIREVVEFVRSECLRYDIEITLTLDNSIYPVLADRPLMSHTIMNLIKNAKEAIGRGGYIEITSREVEDWLEIEIRDNGSGISKENEEKVFEPFFTTKSGGTGLGLPIARRIIEAHGGMLFLRPESGQGSVFVLRLPRGKFLSAPDMSDYVVNEPSVSGDTDDH